MRVTKPDWLESILSNLNWDILGVSLYIGDAIEDGIDWLIEWLNVSLEWGEALYAWAIDLREEVLEVVRLFWVNLNQTVVNILNTISTWGDILNEWWQARLTDIKGLIAIATEGLASLRVAWDNFWNEILPTIFSQFELLRANWSQFWTQVFPTLISFQWLTDWWQGKNKELDSLITAKLQEWFPFFNALSDLWNSIAEFFIDPLEWIQSHVIEPIIDQFNTGFDRGMKGEGE